MTVTSNKYILSSKSDCDRVHNITRTEDLPRQTGQLKAADKKSAECGQNTDVILHKKEIIEVGGVGQGKSTASR